jgi:hypothetical protein
MSNIFKTNSRFSLLIEENEKDKKPILLKNENRRQNNDQVRRYREIEEKKFKGLGEKEKKTAPLISINDFPELISINNKKTSSNQMNFLNLIKKAETKCKEEKIINEIKLNKNLKPESTLLKKDLLLPYREEEIKEVAYEVFKKLEELYEKRSNEYIELWGYDEWEKMFMFSNYDYKYFDKLDKKYAEEMEEMQYTEEMEYTDSNED